MCVCVCVCSEKGKGLTISPMNVSRLAALEQVREIRDYLHVNMHGPNLTSLWFLKNLRIIKGQEKYE